MALNTTNLKNTYLQLMTDMRTREENSDEEFATRFANMMEAYVKSARVKTGITVSTTGNQSAQTGTTTSLGTIE